MLFRVVCSLEFPVCWSELVLGLLLARAGIDVVVLEKHADFLRDFRGDTVHPSTMALLDDLGLFERFDALPQSRLRRAVFSTP